MKSTFVTAMALLAAGAFFSSCDKTEEKIPAYIYIDTIGLSTNYQIQGSDNAKIVDAWLYANDQLIGVDELPTLLPVLEEGVQSLVLRGGIILNGIAGARASYPFYADWEVQHNFVPGRIDTIVPVLSYKAETVFDFIENFEGAGTIFGNDEDNDPGSYVAITNQNVLDNEGGLIHLDSAHPVCRVATSDRYVLPTDGKSVFLEINYTCDIPFIIGLSASSGGINVLRFNMLNLNPKATWNKVYLDLSEKVSNTQGVDYGIYFIAELPPNVEEGNIYLDNIKLVHLP